MKRRCTLSISSWFTKDLNLMKQSRMKKNGNDEIPYSLLSKGSLFMVKDENAHAGIRFVTCLHILSPFRYRHLYPKEDWLSEIVSEEQCQYSLGVHDEMTGRLIFSSLLEKQFYMHPGGRDLAALQLPKEKCDEIAKSLELINLPIFSPDDALDISSVTNEKREELKVAGLSPFEFHGHILPESIELQKEHPQMFFPKWVPGDSIGTYTFKQRRPRIGPPSDSDLIENSFSMLKSIKNEMSLGMCGGVVTHPIPIPSNFHDLPVNIPEKIAEKNKIKWFGMVEGILPPEFIPQSDKGEAGPSSIIACIPAKDIVSFISSL